MSLPGLQRLDHVGFTVPNIDEAHVWLIDVLGCEFLHRLGPYQDPHGTWMTAHLNVNASAAIPEIRLFSCGGQAIFEVFKYVVDDQATEPPRNSDVGGHHVALYVDDLDAAVAYLESRGVVVLGPPTVSVGANEGQRWVYFLAPWGMQFELVSYPNGRAFETSGANQADLRARSLLTD